MFESSSPSSFSTLATKSMEDSETGALWGSPSSSIAIPVGRSTSTTHTNSIFTPWTNDAFSPYNHVQSDDPWPPSPSQANEWPTSVGQASTNTGISDISIRRPPVTKRSLSVNTLTNQNYPSHTVTSRQVASPRLPSSAHSTTSPGLGLATMPEEFTEADYWHGEVSSQPPPTAGFRPGRFRSTSSAAALQNYHAVEDHNEQIQPSQSRSASLWTGGTSPGTYAYAARHDFNRASATPGQIDDSLKSVSDLSNQSPSDRGRRIDYRVSRGASKVTPSNEIEDSPLGPGRNVGEPGPESRRHSIAAPAERNRAIGFEVSRPRATSRNTSVGPHGSQAPTPRTQQGYGMFGGGGLAISDDDLAADLDSLHFNLDQVAEMRHRMSTSKEVGVRVPSSLAASSGAHAASMPPMLGERNVLDIKSYNMGADSNTASSWDLTSRVPPPAILANSERPPPDLLGPQRMMQHAPSTQAKTRAESISSAELINHQESLDGTHSFIMSPTAKAFNGGHVGTNLGDPSSSSTSSSDLRFEQKHKANLIPTLTGGVNPQGHHAFSKGNVASHHQPLSMSNTSSASQERSLPSQQRHSDLLSDYTIASLASLGPIPPSTSGPHEGPTTLQELGKGVPLQMLPRDTPLYIVEFKQGRTDLYFRQLQSGLRSEDSDIRKGDLVIVEADRGKDLGTVIDASITVDKVQSFLTTQSELARLSTEGQEGTTSNVHPAAVPLARLTRNINPKRLFAKATPADTSLLHSKAQDEERAFSLCSTKVNQRGLPMAVVAAEMQWDRRKLTFYYTATQRVDFRDLVKELFRLYKMRIYLCHLRHPNGSTTAQHEQQQQ